MKPIKINDDLVVINSPQMDNNTYLLLKDKKVVVIDPSFAGDEIVNYLDPSYKVVAIILTHAHFDHCFDTTKLIKAYDCPVYIHKEDKKTYQEYNYANLVDLQLDKFDKNVKFFSGKELVIDNFKFEVTLTPGHTQGSVCYRYNDYVFVGDTLFYDSCGRTDLLGSNPHEMIKSLKHLWKYLKDDDLILCGHSKNGKFAEIKQYNNVVRSMIE